MVNIGTGNLVLQEDDMNVPHKGVALAYRRTYNLQSGHDVNGSDGSAPSMTGNGWTSTWDAHISGDPTRAIAVWDIDGARYDYVLGSDGKSWLSQTAGQHATLDLGRQVRDAVDEEVRYAVRLLCAQRHGVVR